MKKVLLIGLCLILVVGLLQGCGLIKKEEPINWDALELGAMLPEPEGMNGEVGVDLKRALSVTLYDVTKEQYKEYRDKCIALEYVIESEDTGTSYVAFNHEGYKLRLVLGFDDLNVYLDAPEEMSEFEWPKSGLGAMLPVTESLYGRIAWNNSENYIVHVGNTTIDEYSEYVEACEAEGFDVDFSKESKYFTAKNAEGYKLTLRYLGFNTIEVSLKAPEKPENNDNNNSDVDDGDHDVSDDNDNDTNNSEGNQNDSQGSNNNTGMSADFKAAMDSYEQFMDEYVAFMKKYKQNPGDFGLLTEYATFMSEYAKFVEDFGKWQDEDLNTEELAYYIEVQSRVTKKLLEITQ